MLRVSFLRVFDYFTTNSPPRRLCCIFLCSLSRSLKDGLVWAYRVCANVCACAYRCINKAPACVGKMSMYISMCVFGSRSTIYVYALFLWSALCGSVSSNADLLLSRLISEEIKVSVSQSRREDTGRDGGARVGGIRHPAGTSEILIRPSLYFPSTTRHNGWAFRQSEELFCPSI